VLMFRTGAKLEIVLAKRWKGIELIRQLSPLFSGSQHRSILMKMLLRRPAHGTAVEPSVMMRLSESDHRQRRFSERPCIRRRAAKNRDNCRHYSGVSAVDVADWHD
jgi:hypothetical protein